MTPKEQWKLAWTLARLTDLASQCEVAETPRKRLPKRIAAALNAVLSADSDLLATYIPGRILRMQRLRAWKVGDPPNQASPWLNCRCVSRPVVPE